MIDISIDMIDVGDASSCIVWLKDHKQNHCIILIDGGNPDDGKRVVEHLDGYSLHYSGHPAPDIVIATHPDKDHAGGLDHVLRHYGRRIGEFWIHDPAKHMLQGYYTFLKGYLQKRSATTAYTHILESLEYADSLISLADALRIPRVEPFAGLQRYNGLVSIIGPTVSFYRSLLPNFSDLEGHLQSRARTFNERRIEEVNELVDDILETMDSNGSCYVLDAENETSAENQSSAVLLVTARSGRYLFPSDAGVNALIDVHRRTPLDAIYWLQVPHHGSRHNLTSELIATMKPTLSYISAIGSMKHPRKALVNYLKKKGSRVFSTHRSGSLWHHRGTFPYRPGYKEVTPL